ALALNSAPHASVTTLSQGLNAISSLLSSVVIFYSDIKTNLPTACLITALIAAYRTPPARHPYFNIRSYPINPQGNPRLL
ncbi:hypothetical protein, partial [Nitrosospira sp. Nsp14]|uniref:hypothetical protein n=1 Tax=Nitrosospira sp. Nsp14 TaxID=1855333 RepID=UPI001C42E888